MATTFLISDTHFGHEKTCTVFKREDGTTIATFDGAITLNTGCVCAEFEFTATGWRLGAHSGTQRDVAGAMYYGVIGEAGA